MSAAQGVSGFVANLVGAKSEDQVSSDVTYIHPNPNPNPNHNHNPDTDPDADPDPDANP